MPWYAITQIRQGTALAYDVGHLVPDGNVKRHGYDRDDLVTWVEPGDDTPEATAASVLMGVFRNAPQRDEPEPVRPPAPVEEGTRAVIGEPGDEVVAPVEQVQGSVRAAVAESPPVKPTAKAKPSDGANTTSSEG